MPALLVLAAALASAPAPAASVSEVVVTGAPYGVTADQALNSVEVVKRAEIDRAPAAGLGDVLAGVPGVRSSFFGPGASRPVIRGLSGPRVLVLANGVGMIDASGLSPDHQVAADPQEAERIEVLRGPAALAYGGQAMGGVVNVIDGRIRDVYQPGVHGRAGLQGATVDDGREAAAALAAGLGGGWMATLDGTTRRAQDYRAPRAGQIPNTFVDLDAYGAGLSRVGDSAWGGLAIKRTATRYGSAAEPDVHIALAQTRLDARGGAEVGVAGFDKLSFSGGWARYRHTEFEGEAVGSLFRSQGAEGRLELSRDHDGRQAALGLQLVSRTLDVSGEEAPLPRTRVSQGGLFGLTRQDFDGWGFEGGARIDTRRLTSDRGRREFTGVSASAGVFVRPARGWFAGLTAAHAARAPTEEELFSDGPHPATGAYEVGDPALRMESADSLELALHYARGPWRADLHAFAARYRNFVDETRTGGVDEASGLPVFRFGQSRATFHGGEAELAYQAWRDGDRALSFEAGLDYVRASTPAGPPPRIPPWSASGKASWRDARWSASAELRHVAPQRRVAALETTTAGYTLLGLELTATPWRTGPELFAKLDNAGDALAREHASFLKDMAPLPGRSLRAGLNYRF